MTKEDLANPLWRLQNLYACRLEGEGKAIPFRPRPEQQVLLKHLHEQPNVPIYVVKSRRLGISTAIDTAMLDLSAWTSGFRGVIIDQKQADATKKMVEIVRFAYDSLDPRIRAAFKSDKRNDGELRIRHGKEDEKDDSVIFATTGSRGGDCSMLHVSEWGPIAATDPTRSKEIRSGAFPAARKGRRVVETTWMGGKGGDLWELIKPILEADPNGEGVLYFFPWHSDPEAIKLDGLVTDEIESYFRDLTGKMGKTFSPEQKKWYAAKKLEQGIFVKREYPSTLDEAFSAPVQGSIYGPVLDQLRAKGHIKHFEWDRARQVFAFWDLGWNDATSVWLAQIDKKEVNWIDCFSASHVNAAEVLAHLMKKGYPLYGHFIPHDGKQTSKGNGLTYKQELENAGAMNVSVVPQCHSIWPGINVLRNLLHKSYFRAQTCEEGLNALQNYHTKEIASGGSISEEPVHDWSSHYCDAARTLAEAYELGMLQSVMNRSPKPTFANIDKGDPVDVLSVRRSRRQDSAISGFVL